MGTRQRSRPRELPGKLLEIRSRLDIGQAEMARRLQKAENSVYPGMVSRYEHGKLEPSLLVLLEYARLAGVLMESLVDDNLQLGEGSMATKKYAPKVNKRKGGKKR